MSISCHQLHKTVKNSKLFSKKYGWIFTHALL